MSSLIEQETEVENMPVKYPIQDIAIANMKEEFAGLSADTPQGYEEVRKALAVTRTARTTIEKTRKKLKEDSLAYGRKVDGEAKRLTALIEAIETPLLASKSAVDDEKARIAREKEEAERAKVEAELKARRDAEEAALRAEREKEEARLKAEREALEAERAKLEEARKAQEERERIERERVEAEQAKVREEQARVAEAQRIEQEKIAAEQRKIQEEKDRLGRLEFERIAKEKAEIEAREKLERERVERERLAKEKAEREAAEAERVEALKPDVEKINAFAAVIRQCQSVRPVVQSAEARKFLLEIIKQIDGVADRCESFEV